MAILLIHGGLAEKIGADRFWVEPGVVAGFTTLGFDVIAPDRNTTPPSWSDAASEIARLLDGPTTIVAGSNGASVALRLAVDHPEWVDRLVLLWPATGGDRALDAQVPDNAKHLLTGNAIRGVADAELEQIRMPVSIMASEPENPFHQHHTVDRLLELIGGSRQIVPGFPESVRPEFVDRLADFFDAVRPHLGPSDSRKRACRAPSG